MLCKSITKRVLFEQLMSEDANFEISNTCFQTLANKSLNLQDLAQPEESML